MERQRKSPKLRKPPSLQLVPSSARPSLASLGIDEAGADELRELIRSINQNGKKKEKPTGNDELPPAA
jgi:hypothetical protein